jgi:hypothetical protein
MAARCVGSLTCIGVRSATCSVCSMSTKKPSWSQVKAILVVQEPKELLKLIGDLYRLSKDDRVFIESRFLAGEDALAHYKQVIADALYPDVYKNKPIRLSVGKKAISDYRKATGDDLDVLELMVHYLEQGNDFTAEYGDIDEQFYTSLESMLDRILELLADQNAEVLDQYVPRLEQVVLRASGIGWGYHDYISDRLEEFLESLEQS